MPLANGRYAIDFNGEYACFMARRDMRPFHQHPAGRVFLLLRMADRSWQSFGFLVNDGVRFFKAFEAKTEARYLDRIRKAVARILADPAAAAALYKDVHPNLDTGPFGATKKKHLLERSK
jgi:hypothetical protein